MKNFINSLMTPVIITSVVLVLTYRPDFKKPETQSETLIQIEPVIQSEPESKDQSQEVRDLAKSNGFKPSQRIVDAILKASETYQIDALELTAIGIVETGLGKYARTRKNSNGTHDRGVFQINTVNYPKCVEYNLDSPEGSSLCAAKLLSQIKTKRADYLGVYHSKTPSKKAKYMQKITKVLAMNDDK